MKKSPVYIEFGKRIADLRAKKSLSQDEVAKKLNMGQSTYAGYESAVRKVPMDTIIQLAEFYNVTPNFLITGGLEDMAERSFEIKSDTLTITNETDKKIIKKFLKLTDRNKYRIEGRIDGYIEEQEKEKRESDTEFANELA